VNSSGFGGKVISVRGFADDCLPVLKNEQFDIVYIDGDHSYRAVLKDLNNAKGLCRENGILCGDDLELQYTGANKQAIELNLDKDFATDPDSGTGFHPGVTKAVWDVFGQEVSCYGGFWAMRKSGDKFTSITIPG
jgi:predicted O-methyltransferase YrrM